MLVERHFRLRQDHLDLPHRLRDLSHRGKVFVRDVHTSGLNDRQLSKLRLNNIGFVFQNFNLIAPFSFPIMLLSPPPDGKSGRRDTGGMAQLEKLGLVEPPEEPPAELSGGQKAAWYRPALVTNPRILLCTMNPLPRSTTHRWKDHERAAKPQPGKAK